LHSFKAPCTPYCGDIKNNKYKIAFTCFCFSIPFEYKNTQKICGHMKVHTFQKNPKRSGHMKAHNIILEFVPSGICETNICRDNLIRTWRQTNSKDESRITSRSSLGESTPSYHDKYHYPMLVIWVLVKSLSLNKMLESASWLFHFNNDLDDICLEMMNSLLTDKRHIHLRSTSVRTYTFFTTGFPRFLSICGARGLQAFDLPLLTSYSKPNYD
jgi:hypothetical protein